MFRWYEYIAALFVPSVGTTDITIKVETLTNFRKQAFLDRTKAIQALNEEQIQMRKVVIHNRMALDMHTAAQGGTCWGPASAGSRKHTQEERHQREREKTHETHLDRAKSVRERERENMTIWGCLQGLSESGKSLFFTIAFIP